MPKTQNIQSNFNTYFIVQFLVVLPFTQVKLSNSFWLFINFNWY